MGDRCYIQIECLRVDYESVLKDFFPEILEEAKHVLTVADDQANYAYADECQNWSVAGICFLGFHGEGGNYGPFMLCSDGSKYYEQPTHHDHELVVAFNPRERRVDARAAPRARRFLDARDRANKKLDVFRSDDGGAILEAYRKESEQAKERINSSNGKRAEIRGLLELRCKALEKIIGKLSSQSLG